MDSIDQAPCFYFACNDNGTLVNINEKAAGRLGYSKDELIDANVDSIFTIATRIFQQTHFFPLLKMQGHADEIFITLQSKTKEHIPLLINAEWREAEGAAVIIYVGIEVQNRKKFEDELISARKAAEKALAENTGLIEAKKELQRHMEKLDKQVALVSKQNRELMQFNKVVTHDLQEPIRKLSVFFNMIERSEEGSPSTSIMEKLGAVIGQMRTVVSGLQKYLWLTETALTYSQIDLNELINEVANELRKEYTAIALNIEVKHLPQIYADEPQLKVLFYQLLSNAIRFKKPDDLVSVHVAALKLMQNKFRNTEGKYKYTECIKLSVSDIGIGIDTKYKDKAFELFSRLHPQSGSGIGLSLCKKIAENHHGDIFIDSKEGDGTTITLLIPTGVDNDMNLLKPP